MLKGLSPVGAGNLGRFVAGCQPASTEDVVITKANGFSVVSDCSLWYTYVKELPSSTRTAQLAADAVGTALGSIVKSLVFIADDDRTVLALVAGDQRADVEKIARHARTRTVRIANAEEVRARTTYAIGGVPPVAHPDGSTRFAAHRAEGRPITTFVDRTLLRFEKVWAAAGAPNAVFGIELKKLLELTQGRVEDIVVTGK